MIRLLKLGRLRNAYLFRGFAVWAGLRFAAAYLGIPDPNPVEGLLILGVVPCAVLLDARRRGEDVLLGNLGVPGRAIAGVALLVPVPLELLV